MARSARGILVETKRSGGVCILHKWDKWDMQAADWNCEPIINYGRNSQFTLSMAHLGHGFVSCFGSGYFAPCEHTGAAPKLATARFSRLAIFSLSLSLIRCLSI